jgi:hypothetical protein
MGRWLKELKARNIQDTHPQGSAKGDRSSSVTFGTSLPGDTENNQRASVTFGTPLSESREKIQGVFKTLRQAMQQAADWSGLEAVLAEVQTAFQAGKLSQEQAEALGRIALQEARTLPEAAGDAPGLRLSELFAAGPVRRVWSGVLGEEVLFLADDAEEPEEHGLTVYRESEMRRLVGMDPEQLKAVHLTKAMLDGEVIDAYEEGTAIMEPNGGLSRLEAKEKAEDIVCTTQSKKRGK